MKSLLKNVLGTRRRKANPRLERVWVTERGEQIRIGDMTGDHARNALAMVMEYIDKGHPVWTDAKTGQFKFDGSIIQPKPLTMVDVLESLLISIDAIQKAKNHEPKD